MKLPRGFEGRIQLALVLTAAIPLGVGVFVAREMLSAALSGDPTLEVTHTLQESVIAHQQLFKTRRELDEVRADLLTEAPALEIDTIDPPAATQAILTACAADRHLLGVTVHPKGARRIKVTCPRPPDAPKMRSAVLHRTLAGGAPMDLTFGMEESAYRGLENVGIVSRLFQHAEASRAERIQSYWLAFGLLLGIGVVLAWLLGVRLARDTTRRIAALSTATRKVSEGDLDVEVPAGGDDELADLADAFNTMVREIRERGQRIVYLEKISSWQEIARRLAHEIKNPLTPIQLSVQQLKSRYPGGDARFEALLDDVVGIVREEVETLRRLVSEFSEFARLPDVSTEPTDLVAWVDAFVRGHPDLAEGASIELDLPKVPVWAALDQALMRRVLTNLVENARQAAEGAGMPAVVRLGVSQTRKEIHLTVTDEGPGIPEDLVDRIFDPYFTTKQTGTGLGLPICKKIVLQHGGEIEAQRLDEGGSRFDITLRAAEPHVLPAEPLPSAAESG